MTVLVLDTSALVEFTVDRKFAGTPGPLCTVHNLRDA